MACLSAVTCVQAPAPAPTGRRLLAPADSAASPTRGQQLWTDNIYMRHERLDTTAPPRSPAAPPSSNGTGNAPPPPDLIKMGNGAEVYMTGMTMQGDGAPDAAALSIGAADTSSLPSSPGRAYVSGVIQTQYVVSCFLYNLRKVPLTEYSSGLIWERLRWYTEESRCG
jgi:hypothetical protein